MSELFFNRKALHDYEILEKYEAGLVLTGFEVKSIRNGRLSLQGAYVVIISNEAWLLNANIPAYQGKNTPANYNPTRTRKLLLNRREISELIGKTKQKGLTLTPLRVYNKRRLLKLEFGLGRGKKQYDKRETTKKREFMREKQRLMNQRK